MKKRVCIVSGYPPGIGKGAEQVYNLAEELRGYGQLDITVLGNKVTGAQAIERSQDLTIIRIWRPNSWISIFRTIYRLIKMKPDIVHIAHAHLYYGGAIYTATFFSLLLITTKVLGAKSLIWMEHVYPLNKVTRSTMEDYHYSGSPPILRFGLLLFTKLTAMLTSQVLVQTEVDLQILKKDYKVKNARRLVIGMKGKRIAKEKAKRLLNLRNKKLLLVFGFISHFKGIEYAIKALPKVVAAFPDSVLVIAGSIHPRLSGIGVNTEPLKLLAKKVRMDNNIVFRDSYIPPTEHHVYYSAADVVLLPYLTSLGPSSVMMEAFQYHTPVIASDVDFLRNDISDGSTGFLVPPRDCDALASAINKFIGDDKLRRAMEKNVALVAGNYSVEEVGKRLRDIYLSL